MMLPAKTESNEIGIIRAFKRLQGVLIFLPYWIVLMLFTKHSAICANDQSRLATMESLVERGTFAIDDSTFNGTVDKIFVNGHFYSSKPPVLSFLGAGLYFILHHCFNLSMAHPLTYYCLTLFLIGVPSTLLLAFFYWSLAFTDLKKSDYWIVTYALGLGTLIFSYSVVINNHTVAASLLYLGFYFLLRIKHLDYDKTKFIFAAGFFSALAAVIDVPPGIVFLVLFYILLIVQTKSLSPAYVLGALGPFALYAVLNFAILGDVLPAQLHGELYHYPGSYWNDPKGIDALHEPKLIYAFHALIGNHGLLLFTPLLVFPPVMLVRIFSNRSHPFWREAVVISFGCFIIILFYIFWTSNYGGVAFGFRYFIPFTPLLFFFLSFFFVEIQLRRKRMLFYALLYPSVALATIGARNPWIIFYPHKLVKVLLGFV